VVVSSSLLHELKNTTTNNAMINDFFIWFGGKGLLNYIFDLKLKGNYLSTDCKLFIVKYYPAK
jgi:hypothetical protein